MPTPRPRCASRNCSKSKCNLCCDGGLQTTKVHPLYWLRVGVFGRRRGGAQEMQRSQYQLPESVTATPRQGRERADGREGARAFVGPFRTLTRRWIG